MAAKKKSENVELETPVEVKAGGITLCTTDFGREDLNALRDKLNEVINAL